MAQCNVKLLAAFSIVSDFWLSSCQTCRQKSDRWEHRNSAAISHKMKTFQHIWVKVELIQ